jgi:hypothetical protein
LPDLRTQTPGDAVPVYKDAIDKFQPLLRESYMQPGGFPFPNWTHKDLADFPRDEARKALEPYKEVLDLIDKAARCERCLGEGAARDALLQNTYVLQEIANLVAVRARVQIADGDFNGAIRMLQTGLSMGRQVGELPRGYSGQTGTDIAQTMFRQVEDLMQQPRAPNLYWALADLPRPFIDQRRGVEGDRQERLRRFTGLAEAAADLSAAPMTEEQVQDCVREILRYTVRQPGLQFQTRAALSKRLTEHYDDYKKVLLDQGRPKDKVEAMSYVEVTLLAELKKNEETLDEQMKWYNEPFYKAGDALDALAKVVEAQPPGKYVLPLSSSGLGVLRTRAALERRIDFLRCVEAIRAYAAAHDGKAPSSLADVKELPIPLDAVTGKPFVYKKDGDTVTLESPEVPRQRRAYFDDLALEFTIKR